jgi:foldase protein PrsA
MEKGKNNEITKKERNLSSFSAINRGKEPVKTFKVSKKLAYFLFTIILVGIGVFAFMSVDFSSEEDIAAIVNGEIITVTELNNAFDSLPQQYLGVIDKESLLDQIIQAKIFYQEGVKQGITASNEDIELGLQLTMASSGLTDEQFFENLAVQGMSEMEFREQFGEQLTIQRFIDKNLLDKIQISEEEVQEYYSNNIEQFQVGEQVVVKHILIGNEDLSAEEQDAKAVKLLSQLTEDNFCNFVNDFSTDLASLQACGEYVFTRNDAFVEEFKKLSFDQKAGEMGIVRTQFGPHIIWTVEKIPAKTSNLEEVSDQISDFIKTKKGQEQYKGFYQDVSKNSVIEIKLSEFN